MDSEGPGRPSSGVLFPAADRCGACSQIVSAEHDNGAYSSSAEKEDTSDGIGNYGVQNENIIEENVSSEERSELIKMAMKGEFALNAEVAKKGKRQTSKQKAEQQMSLSSGNHFQVLDDSTVSETSQDEGRYSGNWMKKSPKNLNRPWLNLKPSLLDFKCKSVFIPV
ncbi:uncharacterized protein O9250_012283 isoform 1-T3 [Rhynochetos jubatus]